MEEDPCGIADSSGSGEAKDTAESEENQVAWDDIDSSVDGSDRVAETSTEAASEGSMR